MKRILTMILVITMMVAMSATAFATGNTVVYDKDATSQTSGLSVTYNVQPTFSVTIPASVALDNSVIVSTSDVVVEYGKAVKVKLTGTSETDNSFVVKTDEGATLNYAVKRGEVPVSVGDTILSVTPTDTTASVELTFVKPESYVYAGLYKGTVTFTIVVE